MTQAELDQAVARVTGDSVATVAEHGFVPLTPVTQEHEPLTVDWDEVDALRPAILPVGGPRVVAARRSRPAMPM